MIHGIAERVAGSASVKSVYGDPVVVGERTVIPVAQVFYGFGGGGGRPKGESPDAGGGGGGGGVCARPHGAIEITPEGTRFVGVNNPVREAAALAVGFFFGAALAALAFKRR